VGNPGDFPGQNQALPYLSQVSVTELALEQEMPDEEIPEILEENEEETIENT
jgi:hypothetical protein